MHSEAACARSLLFDIALPARTRGADEKGQITYVYGALAKRNRPGKRWTWRRVKALWYGEVPDSAVRAWQLGQLEETAALLAEARNAHAQFIQETERLAAMLAHTDADFHGPEIAARRSVVGGVDLSRTAGGRR